MSNFDNLRWFLGFAALSLASQVSLAQRLGENSDNHPQIREPIQLQSLTVTPECSLYANYVSSELQKIIDALTAAEKSYSRNTESVSIQLKQELAQTSSQRETLQKSCEASGGFPRSEQTGEK
jgi:hypothetical protein